MGALGVSTPKAPWRPGQRQPSRRSIGGTTRPRRCRGRGARRSLHECSVEFDEQNPVRVDHQAVVVRMLATSRVEVAVFAEVVRHGVNGPGIQEP
jgi:hypothetical protein